MLKIVDLLRWRFTRIYWLLVYLQHFFLRPTFRRLREQQCSSEVVEINCSPNLDCRGSKQKETKSILYLVHWFDLGGAESFALDTIRLAKSAGFSTHVYATVPSANSDYDLFADVADQAGVSSVLPDADAIAKYIIENDIRILHIHHSKLGYQSLPLLRKRCADLYVIDSTHIVELRDGGFPKLAAKYSDYIDIHHVISMQLAKYIEQTYRELHGSAMNCNKVVLTYILPSFMPNHWKKDAIAGKTFNQVVRVLYYGRLENQKQPYLFCRLIRMLNEFTIEKRLGISFKGLIVGAGSLEASLKKYHTDAINSGALELLGRIDDKDYVYNLADIVVLPSRNEGITLTSFEAIARGIPVVSSDVGAQSELLPSEMLVDIWKCNPIPDFISRIIQFSLDSDFRKMAIKLAQKNFMKLSKVPAYQNMLLSIYSRADSTHHISG